MQTGDLYFYVVFYGRMKTAGLFLYVVFGWYFNTVDLCYLCTLWVVGKNCRSMLFIYSLDGSMKTDYRCYMLSLVVRMRTVDLCYLCTLWMVG